MRWLLLFLVPFTLGCPSVSVLGSARTLDQGKTRYVLGVMGAGDTVLNTPQAQKPPIPVAPQIEFAIHHGVSDRIELGGRVWTSGLQFDSKFSLLRSKERGFDLAIAPSLGVIYFPVGSPTPSLPVQVAVLGGYNLDGLHFFLGPRLMDRIVFYAGPINTFYAGGNLGVSIRVSETLRIAPELALMTPLFSTAHDVYVEAGLALLFGGG
jgi:hypothetical protein